MTDVRKANEPIDPGAAPRVESLISLFAGTRFRMSAASTAQLPDDPMLEAAFVGRSNAGKSSALNALCAMKGLARVSKTPGRTQLINLFDLPAGARLVDLPGYGYAHVPEPMRRRWGELVGGYVRTRQELRGLVVVMDIRHPLTPIDRQMLDWARACLRPCHILLTKADKLGFGAGRAALQQTGRALVEAGYTATVQLYSANTGDGVEPLRERLAGWLELPVPARNP